MSGGGESSYQAAQAAEEAKKQAARDALNLQFGVAPTVRPNRDSYNVAPVYGMADGGGEGGSQVPVVTTPGYFDQAGYDAAVAAWDASAAEAAKVKAAREALYGKVRDDAFTAGKTKLDESRTGAARDLKFSLFGQGLNGGSVDVDQNAKLGRTYNQGLLDLGGKADAAAADLRGSDESTRLGLLQSIDAGMDQGSAISSSLAQLRTNSDRAAADAQGTALGDLFGNAGLLYQRSEAGRGRTDAQNFWNTYYGNQGRRTGGYTGTISGTGGG